MKLFIYVCLLALPGVMGQFNFTCGNFLYGMVNITSPNHPFYYEDNLDCWWYLDVFVRGLSVHFDFFSTEADKDYVTVWSEWDTSKPAVLDKRSGTWDPFVVDVVGTNRAIIHFHSDASGTDRGFLARVLENVPTTTKDPIYGCGSTLTGESGELNSPNYPGHYFNNWDCQTRIKVNSDRRIHVTFTDFDMEERLDYVKIYDGPSTSSPVLLTASGTALPPAVTSLTNQIVVQFFADVSINEFRGWHLNYTAV